MSGLLPYYLGVRGGLGGRYKLGPGDGRSGGAGGAAWLPVPPCRSMRQGHGDL